MGSAAGGAVVCLVLFVFSGTTGAAAAHPIMPQAGPGIAAGGGALAAAIVAWTVARPIVHAYARGALAMMAVMGATVVAGLTVPAHVFLGRAGLILLAALCVGAIAVARRFFLQPPA